MEENNKGVGGLPWLPPQPGISGRRVESRAATMENPTGTKGGGGKAGNGRKGCPSLSPFRNGETVTLLATEGPGCIRHCWMTTPPGNP